MRHLLCDVNLLARAGPLKGRDDNVEDEVTSLIGRSLSIIENAMDDRN